MNKLFYITDPMCSWCYAFKGVLQQLRQRLPEQLEFITLLGGLATDTDSLMPIEMQQQLQATWQRIEKKVPGIQFNYDFWKPGQSSSPPRRSTYPACRAVIAAHAFDNQHNFDNEHYYRELMIEAIQTAYYQQARNPSDDSTLITLAGQIGLDEPLFQSRLKSNETEQELQRQIALSRQLNANSYPSLVLQTGGSFWPISIDYTSPEPILQSINTLLDFE